MVTVRDVKMTIIDNLGINAVSGTQVVNPALASRCVSQGATFRQIKGIRLLTMKKDQR